MSCFIHIHHSTSPYSAFENNPVYWSDPRLTVTTVGDKTTFTGADALSFFNQYNTYMDNGSEGAFVYPLEGSFNSEFAAAGGGGGDGNDPQKASDPDKKILGPKTSPKNSDGSINSDMYNCHSYAWHNSLGDPSDPANIGPVSDGYPRWDNDPTNNLDGWERLPFDAPNKPSDRIIYYAWDSKTNSIYPTHSAIVTEVNSGGRTTRVTSKWGAGFLYSHHPRDINPSYGSTQPTFVGQDGNSYASRIYYRKK